MRRKLLWTLVVSTCLLFAASGIAWAHVEITPAEVLPGATQQLTVEAAGEKDVPATKVRVEVPQGFTVTNVGSPSGWQGSLEGGSIVWSGGEIAPDRAGEFTFEAQAPQQAGRFAWNGFVTYQDGSVIEWTGPPDSERPAAVVEVAAQGGGTTAAPGDDHGGETSGQGATSIPATGGIAPASLYWAVGISVLALVAAGVAVGRWSLR